MTLTERIEKDYIVAYKAKDQIRLDVLRLLKAAAKNVQVEKRRPITDEELFDVVLKQGKQRQDSIEQFRAGGRADLADKEAAELCILQAYLPKALTPEELEAAITQAITETSATSAADMGKVMQAIMAAHKGQVDGKTLSASVRAHLQTRGKA